MLEIQETTLKATSAKRLLLAFVLCALFLLTSPNKAWSQEFRIESQVYTQASNLPVSQSVTLFSQGIVYDFLMSNEARPKPVETVIFESRTKMLVLLDPKRQVRLELPELRIIKIVDSVRRELVQDARTKHLVEDTFNEDNDWATGWVTLESPRITYRYAGERPKDPTILPIYYEFLDAFTRMKATDPTKTPPFDRLKLNNSIRRFGRMPTEVHKTVKGGGIYKKDFKAHSKHVVVNKLSDIDRKRIAQAKMEWLNFKAVDLTEYRQLKADSKLILPRRSKQEKQPVQGGLATMENSLESKDANVPTKKDQETSAINEAPPQLDPKVVPASNHQMLEPIAEPKKPGEIKKNK